MKLVNTKIQQGILLGTNSKIYILITRNILQQVSETAFDHIWDPICTPVWIEVVDNIDEELDNEKS